MSTPRLTSSYSNTLGIIDAWREAGKSLPSSSSINGIPIELKNFSVSESPNRENMLSVKPESCPWYLHLSIFLFVILHLPFPVTSILRPIFFCF
jgi:hypothetical protein